MTIQRSALIARLTNGEPAFGNVVHSGDISGARKMGDSTFDFALVDLEHEGFDMPALGDTLQWLMSRRQMRKNDSVFAPPTPLVRLPHTAAHRTTWIAAQALDYGALGIVLPYTEHPEEVEQMVRAMRYPREEDGALVGERRVWPKAAMRYWGCADFDEYFAMADLWPLVEEGQIVLMAMVATPTAKQNIKRIAAVAGLSGILFGAKHAWSALGRRGKINLDDPDLTEFRDSVLNACKDSGLVAGTSVSAVPFSGTGGTVDQSFMQHRIDDGFRFFLTQGSGRPEI
jgi:4-hydroxy-2-oxoheptanedioate aldolase